MKSVEMRTNGSRRVQIFTEGPTKVEQSHKKKCNINTIVSKCRKTGQMPVSNGSPLYGDFTSCIDYHTSMERVKEAERDFMKIPAEIRKEFDNDPAKMIDFLMDPENRQEAIEMGLIEKEVKEPLPEPIVAQEPSGEPQTPTDGSE